MNLFPRNYEGGVAVKSSALLLAGLVLSGCGSLVNSLTPTQRFELDYTGLGVADSSADGVLRGQACLKNTVYDPNRNAASFEPAGDTLTIRPYNLGKKTLVLSGLGNIDENLMPVDDTSEAILKYAGCNISAPKR